METLSKQILPWEIHLLVLLSFGLQIFLFFTGGLRRHGSNKFLRLSIWIAYLGADMVAVYALGYLSRHEGVTPGCDTLRGTHPLAFFWAPFLIIHLGGQDTITAFAMEDNSLWLRHLLNLVVQVALAIYVFWKSMSNKQSMELLISGIALFIAGIIKYGERIWSLKSGSFESLKSSTGNHYKHRLPEAIHADGSSYCDAVCTSLLSMVDVFHIFSARPGERYMRQHGPMQPKKLLKVLEVQLGMMYDDLYTKAHVLRTKSGILLRGISQMCLVVALTLFLAGARQSYRRADIVVTYSLFAGSFFLEACAVFIFMTSPWTLAWLQQARKQDKLARFSWFLFSMAWPEKRPLWANVVGQCNLYGWLEEGQDTPRSCSQLVRTMVTKLGTLIGLEKEKVFWVSSKLFGTEYVKADNVMDCLLQGVARLFDEQADINGIIQIPQIWLKDRDLMREAAPAGSDGCHSSWWQFVSDAYTRDFSSTICVVHFLTEVALSECSESELEARVEAGTEHLVELCRALSRYTMYLLVNHPSLLPVSANTVATLERSRPILQEEIDAGRVPRVDVRKLEEIRDVWTGIIIYVAAKSRPEMHAAQLARGGELLTFVWLLLAEYKLGDSGGVRLELTNLIF